ncbi:MAG: hypothetical protein ACYC5O_06190 [Anaerolineae bacterium]
MIIHGPMALSDLLGDLVVFRNLQPIDAGLPGLADLAPGLGIETGRIPRKNEVDYARVVAGILAATAARRGTPPPRRLVALGDTRMNDVAAFANLCAISDWPGLTLICSEKMAEPARLEHVEPTVYLSNRWAHVGELPALLEAAAIPVDEETVIMLDIDKTAIGARGRNDHTIDQARIEGVRRTALQLLGASYNEDAFLRAYYFLNRPQYHPFTADNQDYLVYVCLIIAAGIRPLEGIAEAVDRGHMSSFAQFIEDVHEHRGQLSGSPLAAVHESVYERFRAGDPTPFKAFRRNEFRATVERIGCLGGTPAIDVALAQEIVATHEVIEMAQIWRDAGAIVFGISDKPDEAALPAPGDTDPRYPPLHRARTHCVGEEIT